MLRITAGEHRGRRVQVPAVTATRPLLEKARQALMDHLGARLVDAVVWDVFAGSGILGFEALSRGAAEVHAVERHRRAAAQLRENAAALGYSDRHQVLAMDARAFLAGDPPAPDVVFFDPPYAAFRGSGRADLWNLFCALAERLTPGGCAAVHTPRGILKSAEADRLPGLERRDYGNASLYWWHAPEVEQ